jgi:N-acetylglucosaminyl-diphospho-decaprenol L-rhamnosyltransferase
MPPIAVVVVTYNNAEHLPALLGSVDEGGAAGARVLVADNSPTGDTARVAATFPGVTVLSTGGNLGYSGGINVARPLVAAREAMAILNPDLVLGKNALARLASALADPAVGIAVPLLREPDGSVFLNLRREPTVFAALGDALFGARWPGRPRWLTDTLRRPSDYATPRDVDWASGAALLVSPACSAAVGDWDSESYFLYSEETDYARRAREAGFRIRFVPEATATHIGGGSGHSDILIALMAVNRVRYFEAHHGRVAAAVYRAVAAMHHLLRFSQPRHRLALHYVLTRRDWGALPSKQYYGRPDQEGSP